MVIKCLHEAVERSECVYTERYEGANVSRIGNKYIQIPGEVTVTLSGNTLEISGTKGKLTLVLPKNILVDIKDKQIIVKAESQERKIKAIHGLIRSQLSNNIIGVNSGWSKTLQLVGVGFRATTDGKKLTLKVGFSHPVEFGAPEDISFIVSGNDIIISGCDKQKVGEVAARIRRIKPPEVYKGKGIRYKDEVIHKKPGKAAKTVGVGTAAAK